jgi:hypothetical protein
MPDRLMVMIAPAYFGIGTGEQFHLGEPLPI